MACPHDRSDPPPEETAAASTQVPLGVAQLRRLLEGAAEADVLPTAEAWMEVAGRFVSTRALIEHLRTTDVLPLQSVCCEVMLEHRLLMAPSMLVRRAEVRIAMQGGWYAGQPEFGVWVRRQVLIALLDGLDAELEAEFGGRRLEDHERAEYALFQEVFGVGRDAARSVMLRMAGLPGPDRLMVFELVVRGRKLEDVASELGFGVEIMRERFKECLGAIGAVEGEPLPLRAPWADMLEELLYDGDEL